MYTVAKTTQHFVLFVLCVDRDISACSGSLIFRHQFTVQGVRASTPLANASRQARRAFAPLSSPPPVNNFYGQRMYAQRERNPHYFWTVSLRGHWSLNGHILLRASRAVAFTFMISCWADVFTVEYYIGSVSKSYKKIQQTLLYIIVY